MGTISIISRASEIKVEWTTQQLGGPDHGCPSKKPPRMARRPGIRRGLVTRWKTDEEMTLVQDQKEARVESLAKRGASKSAFRSKKGQTSLY